MITFEKGGNPIIEAEARVPYELAMGPNWYRFFEGFKEEKIFGTRCNKCNRVLVPARGFCPRCFVDMNEWVEVSNEGVIISWVLTDYEYFGMPTKPPFVTAVIRLDGSDCGFMHLIGGVDLSDLNQVREIITRGTRVKAVWQKEKTGCIQDIEYFKPLSIP